MKETAFFYKTKQWKQTSRAYMQSKHYICERCGQPAVICHHKKWLNPGNVHNPEIALNWDNLEALCMDCHNKEHFKKNRAVFDENGNMTGVKESGEIKNYKKDKAALDILLESLKKADC